MNIIKNLQLYAKDFTILLVEDDISFNNEISELLSLFFKEVKVAHNGKEGLNTYLNTPTDIVMSDINMPLMNGYEMVKSIIEQNYNPQIIILSAHDDVVALRDIASIGVEYTVQKPFEDEILYNKLILACKNLLK